MTINCLGAKYPALHTHSSTAGPFIPPCRVWVVLGVVPLLLAGCVSERADPLLDGTNDIWRIDPLPIAAVGERDGPMEYLFDGVLSVHLLDGDRFLVADNGSSSLRLYDFNGAFVRQIGRKGEGPGEFHHIRGSWLSRPDTVHVLDLRFRRIVRFLTDGTSLGMTPIEPSYIAADHFAGTFDDGSFVVGGGAFAAGDADVVPYRRYYGRYSAEGRYLGRIAEVEGRWFYAPTARPGRPPSPLALSGIHPLSPNPEPVAHGETLHYVNQVKPEVVLRAKDGEVVGTIPLPRSGISVPEAWRELRRALEERGDTAQLAALEGVPEVDSIPQVFGLVIDDEGLIWTKKYDPRVDNRFTSSFRWRRGSGGEWWVVNRDGNVRQTVTVPNGFMPMEIRDSLMIGITLDKLDVERVVVYRILNRS